MPARSAVETQNIMIEVAEVPQEEVVQSADAGAVRAPDALFAEGLKKSYKRRCVVDDVSLFVNRGEVVGLLGPNGAGKTTTFYMMVGLEAADAGRVMMADKDVTTMPLYKRARLGLGFLPQEASIFRKFTVEQNLMAILQTRPLTRDQQRNRMEELIEAFRLHQVRRNKGYMLSGGERRRTEIARMLIIEPKFALLDEPFAGIDPIAIDDLQQIIAQLRDQGIGVLITDHNVREALAITDRAYILSDGKLFRSGKPQELTDDPEVRRVYLGDKFRL